MNFRSLKGETPRTRQCRITAGVAAIFTLAGGQVLAQEASSEGAGVSRMLEEVIVTANKRTQNIYDVGLSITNVSGSAMNDRGVYSTTDLNKVVPGLTVQPSPFNTPVYTLRGIGFYETSLSAAPTVAVYVDEIQLPFSATTKGAALDIERVEVLKGPQGTLFGQNTTGGAINYIANKPTDEFDMGVDAAYDEFERFDMQGYVSGSLTDTVRGRLALGVIRGGEWQESYTRDDDLGDQDQVQARLTVDWAPTDRLGFIFTASGWTDQGETQAGQMITDLCANDFTSPTCLSYQAEDFRNYPKSPEEPEAADWGYGVFGKNLERDDQFYQLSVRIDYELTDTLTLTSISSYSDYDTDSIQDFDGTDLASVDTNTTGYIEDFTQELRLAATLDRVNLIIGANYSDTDTFDRLFYNFQEGASANPLLVPRGSGPIGDYTFNYSDQSIKTTAVFGNVEYSLTDSLLLTAGARYTDSKRDFEGCTNDWEGPSQTNTWWDAIFGTNTPNGGCLTFDPTFTQYDPALFDSLDEDNTSWNIGLNYSLLDEGLVYGRISKGYKAGSFPTASVASYTGYEPVEQESVLAYEIGLKMPLLDNTVNFTTAAFYYDYQDKQLRGRKPDPVFGTLDGLVQIPEGEVQGIEAELVALPFDGLQISLGATYIETEVTEFEGFNALGELLNFAGQEFPFSPEWTVIGDAVYDFPLSSGWNGFVGASLTYNSETSAQLDNTTTRYVTADERFVIDPYTLVDLRAGVETVDGKWKIMAFGYNVTDEYYWTNVQNNLASITRFAGKPQTYGVRVSWRF